MATTKKTTPKSSPKAKAEARVADSATKMIDEGMEQMTGLAGKFGGYAEGGMKALAEQAASSSIALAYQVAQTHQLSPSFKPGKPNSGCGVIKSLPTFFDQSKNLSVTFAQTV